MIQVNTIKKRSDEIYANRPKNQGGFWGGAKYVGASLLAGVGGIAEGVIDIVGALGADLTGNHDAAENMFKNNVVGDWYVDVKADYNPNGVMGFVGDVTHGLGQSAYLFIPYAGAPLFYTGVVANSISDAAAKTGDVGVKEVAYGATMGAVEGAVDALLGGTAKTISSAVKGIGKTAGKTTGKTIFKATSDATRKGLTKKFLSSASSEFAEEFVSEYADTLFQRAYQIDPNASTSLKDAIYAGAVGAVSGAVSTSAVQVPKSINYHNKGDSIIKRGNSQTLVNTATTVADRLAAKGTSFKDAAEWVTALRGQVDAYNDLVKKGKGESASAKTILGEMQAYLYFAETKAAHAGITDRIMNASEEDRAALAEYINMTVKEADRPRTYTAEDVAKNTDEIASQLAIMEFAGIALNYDTIRSDAEYEQEIEAAIAEERGAPVETAVDTEAEMSPEFAAAVERSATEPVRAQTVQPQAQTVQPQAQGGTEVVTPTVDKAVAKTVAPTGAPQAQATVKAKAQVTANDIKTRLTRATNKVEVDGKLYEISKNDIEAISTAAETLIREGKSETEAVTQAVNENLGKIKSLSSGGSLTTTFAKGRISKIKGAIINAYRQQAQSGTAQTLSKAATPSVQKSDASAAAQTVQPQAQVESKAEAQATDSLGKTKMSKYIKVGGRVIRNDLAQNEKSEKKKAAEKSSEHSEKSSESANDMPKASKPKEILADEQRAERARKSAERIIEWNKANKPDVKELNRARSLVKGFDNLSPEKRQSIIRMIRSAQGVDEKTVKGIANLMAIKAGADLEVRFDDQVGEYGMSATIGDKTLILVSSMADYKDTVKGTVAHELVHYLEKKPGYKTFADYVLKTVKPEAKAKVEKDITERYNEHYRAEYEAEYAKRGLKGAELESAVNAALESDEHKALIESEVVAELVGKALNNEKFLARYARRGNTDGFIKKAWSFLKGVVQELKGKEENELAEILMPTIKSMDRLLQMPTVKEAKERFIKYSVMNSDNLSDNVDKILKMSNEEAIANKEAGNFISVMKNTPQIIIDKVSGAENLEIVMRFDSFYLATRHEGALEGHYHNYGEIMKRLPEIISDPQAIIRMDTGRINIYSQIQTKKGNNSIVSIELNTVKDINSKYDKYNLIVSVMPAKDTYAKNNLLNHGVKVEYEKEDLSQVNHQLHEWLAIVNGRSSKYSIPQKSDLSTPSAKKYSLAPKKAETNAKKAGNKVEAAKAEEKQSARKSATVVGEYSKRFEKSFDLDKGASEKIAAELEAIENAFVKGDEEYADVFRRRVGNIAGVIAEKANFEIASDYDTLSDFSRYMVRKRFRVDSRFRSEMGNEWKDIYKSLKGRIASDKNTQYSHIDTFYSELSEKFPGLFSDEINNIHDQLLQIASVLSETKDLKKASVKYAQLPSEMQSAVMADVINLSTSYVTRIESNRDVIKKLRDEVSDLDKTLKKERGMRERMARERAEYAKVEGAQVFAKKDVEIAVKSIEGWTQEEVLSLAKGQELQGMSRAKREEMISQIYIALHEEGSKGRVGTGYVAVKGLATKIADEYLDSAQIKGEDGKSIHLSDIYDAETIAGFKKSLTDLLFGEFAHMGQTTQNAEFQAIIRAQKESFFVDQVSDKLEAKEARNLSYQGKKLRDLVEHQKRDGAAEDIALVTKMLASVVDAKGNIRVNAVDKAMGEAARFFEGEKLKIESEKNALKTEDGKETQALSDFAWTVNEDIKFMIDEYMRLRKGREGKGLTAEEMKLASDVLRAMKVTIERYNKEYIDGHWVDVEAAAKDCVADLTADWRKTEYKNKVTAALGKAVGGIKENYFYKILTPETVVETIEGFAKNGVLKRLYHSIRVHKQKAEHLAVQMKKPLAEFIDSKEHRYTDDKGISHSFRTKLNKKMISVDGADGVADLTLGEAIYLYMLTKREPAHAGLLEEGYIVFNEKNQKRARLKLTDIEITQNNIYNQLDATDIEFLKMAESFFNESASKIKHDADMNIFGYTNIQDGYYVPMIRDRYGRMNGVTDARQSIGSIITVYNKSFNQNLVENAKALEGKNIMSIINDHADGLADYAELYLPLKAFDRTYNRAVMTNDGLRSIREVLNNDIWSGTEKYFKDLFADIQGQREKRDDPLNNVVGKIRSAWVNSVLGANVKVIATQTTSLVAATQVIGTKYITKCSYLASPGKLPGLDEIRERAYKYSDIIEARNFDMGALKAQGNIDKVNKIGELSGWGIGWMDERICLAIFHAAELQVQDQKGYAVGSEENARLAARLADEAIYTTQSMSSASERSAWQRSDSEIMKMLTMFTSDTVKNLSHFFGNINKWNAYRMRNNASDGAYEAEMKQAGKDVRRSIRTLAATGIMLGLIAQAFKYIYGKEEEDPKNKQKDFYMDIAGSTLNILPGVSDVVDKLVFNYDMSINVIDVANDTIESVGAAFKTAGKSMSGEYVSENEIIKNSADVVRSGLTLLGIPVAPVEKLFAGTIRFVSPEAAYGYNNIFGNPSYTADLKKAVESGDAELAEFVLEKLYESEMSGVYTSAELEEIVRLYSLTDENGKHYNVLPQRVPEKLDDDTKMSAAQRKQFNKIYSQSSAKVNELIRSDYYAALDDKAKAKAISNVYGLYFDSAKAQVMGKDWSASVAYSYLTSNVTALMASKAYKSGLQEYKNERGKTVTVKEQFAEYLKGLELSKEDQLIIAYANGYKGKATTKSILKYINSLGLPAETLEQIAKALNLEVKDGAVVEKTE